jgi:predicted SAM-dependent methyltransferase
MMMYKYWRKLPLNTRNNFHLIIHRINSFNFLLKITYFRHFITCIYLACSSQSKIRIGESKKIAGWVSTNYQVFAIYFLDATRNLYFVKDLQYIVADNVIEHLSLDQGQSMLENMFKSLRKGGKIRIATPDLRSISSVYLKRNESMLSDYKKNLQNHNLKIEYFPDLLRTTYNAFGHHKGYIYDFETLEIILVKIGFREVELFRPGLSNDFNLSSLENRCSTSDLWSQMCIEAIKPE